MSSKLPITVVILTKDEEVNLPQALRSVARFADEILIVDSRSVDRTREIALEFGAQVFERDFVNQADQFNWALDTLPIRNDWILRLDADEVISEALGDELAKVLENTKEGVNGFYLRRRVYFMGRWIKHGGYYPTLLLRLFRKGKARSEEREMDEHIVLLEGEARTLDNDFKDDNKKDLAWWIKKHNDYSTREAQASLNDRGELKAEFFGGQPGRKRWLKNNLYGNFPLFVRPTLYFMYRYIIRFGFLDGKEGFIFHFLQGFWYRLLVDAKIWEARRERLRR